MQEILETIAQIVAQDTEPDPEGGPSARRLKQHVAPDRRISIEDADMRHGRKSSAKTFNGFKEHIALDLDSNVTREVVVCSANHPEHEAVELLAEELEQGAGLFQLDIDLGIWRARGLPNGPRKACTSLPAPGRKAGRSLPRTTSRWTSRTVRSRVPTLRRYRWSQARMPSFRPVPVMRVRCARSVPKPGSGTAGV